MRINALTGYRLPGTEGDERPCILVYGACAVALGQELTGACMNVDKLQGRRCGDEAEDCSADCSSSEHCQRSSNDLQQKPKLGGLGTLR